jgi:hypothetical protein|tara:strand:- start:491 stop:880 length:390 start_codon:yes stop_codon:yes gene_type:complete
MAKKNSAKKRQSRVLDAMRRENAILEKQKEKKARKEEQARKSVGEQQREKKRREGLKDAALKTKESAKGIQKKRKVRERKNQNKIVKGVRVGNITKIRKNVSYGGIIIKDSASKQAVLDMLKAEDRMMR